MEFCPLFETGDAYEVIGYTWRGTDNSEIPPLWMQFDQRLGGLMVQSPSPECFGICRDMDDQGAFSYMVGIMKGPDMAPKEDLETWSVPGGNWAVFSTPLSTIQDCYRHIWSVWAKDPESALRDGPTIERYPKEFEGAPQDVLHILVPVS